MGKRMSAHFIAREFGQTASWAYEILCSLGFVVKDKFGDWVLTDLGKSIGGKMSKNNYISVPTFDFDAVSDLLRAQLKKK